MRQHVPELQQFLEPRGEVADARALQPALGTAALPCQLRTAATASSSIAMGPESCSASGSGIAPTGDERAFHERTTAATAAATTCRLPPPMAAPQATASKAAAKPQALSRLRRERRDRSQLGQMA